MEGLVAGVTYNFPLFADALHPMYQELTLKSGQVIYFNKHTGYIETTKPLIKPLRTGGILADEMGLGKTIEVLACILTNTKHELKETTPPFNVHIDYQRKRKLTNVDLNQSDYVDKPKKIKIRLKQKKNGNRELLNMWYNSVLSNDIHRPNKVESSLECICGGTNTDGVVVCVDCDKEQHGECMGYRECHGDYRCPQCWMNQVSAVASNSYCVII